MNSDGRHDRPAGDSHDGRRAAESIGARNPVTPPKRPSNVPPNRPAGDGGGRHRPPPPAAPRRGPGVPPDDRHTAVLPPFRDGPPPPTRDPIDAVKNALDSRDRRRRDGDHRREGDRRREGDQRRGSGPPPPPPGPPRHGGGGPTGDGPSGPPRSLREQINWTWVRRGSLIAAVVLIVLPLLTFGMAYMIVDVPKPGDIRTAQVSTILASDGSEIAKIVPPEGNRIDVNIDQIPVHVRDAVMAAEDRDFYSNPGFSLTGFLRAFKNNIFGGDLQGGSTITQQYVKNALVGDARSGVGGVIRKAKELVISTKMSSEWSKDQVLQSYLNIIYFGRGAYGVAAAAKAYFGKPIEEVTVSEGALLAALIQRPSVLDPAVDPDASAVRWSWVLDGMVEIGALSEQDRAAQIFPPTIPPDQASTQNQTTGPNGLIERQVVSELMEIFDINEQTLNTEGLQITTTIDPKAQSAAQDAVEDYLDGQDPDMRSAVVSIDPKTGGIKAYYGGSDAAGFDFAQAGLPTGSSFKVFALIAALEQGMGLGYQVDSSPLEVNGIKISNVEGSSCGSCNIAEALKRSLNTSYYRLMLKLKNGPQDVADAAHQAGIAESIPGIEHTLSEDGQGGPPNNGIVLGQYQSRVLDMASAYATIAASGVYHKPHFVQKVVNSDGQVLFDATQEDNSGEQRIDQTVAENVIAAMQPIAGYSGRALAGGRPSAAKTGTNQLGDTGENRDAWMVGFTPSLSTAVWVGTVDGTKPLVTSGGASVYGSGLPGQIWKSTMDNALDGTDNETFPKPEEIGGYAGVPQAPPPPPSSTAPPTPSETVIQPTLEIAPGITIPWGPPTTVPVGPPGAPPVPETAPPAPPPPGAPVPPGAPPPPGAPVPPGAPPGPLPPP